METTLSIGLGVTEVRGPLSAAPPPVHAPAYALESSGAYLLETGDYMLLE